MQVENVRRTRRRVRAFLGACLVLLLQTLCQGGAPAEVNELLDRYIKASAWSYHVSMHVQSQTDNVLKDREGTVLGSGYADWDCTYRRSGSKAEWRRKTVTGPSREPGTHRRSKDAFWLVDGTRWFRTDTVRGEWAGSVTRAQPHAGNPNCLIGIDALGGTLYGFGVPTVIVSRVHLGEFLKECGNPQVLGEETVAGVRCQKVQAKTPYGTVGLWIAPEKGYNAMRISYAVREADDKISAKGPSLRDSDLETISYEVETLEFQEVGGVFVPRSGRATSVTTYKTGQRTPYPTLRTDASTVNIRLSEIDLHPDFEGLQAFKLPVPDGTLIQDVDYPGILYEVSGGQLVSHVDGKVIDAIEAEAGRMSPPPRTESPAANDINTAETAVCKDGKFLDSPHAGLVKAAEGEEGARKGWSRVVLIVIIVLGLAAIAAPVILGKQAK
jgi:hypothetical protein